MHINFITYLNYVKISGILVYTLVVHLNYLLDDLPFIDTFFATPVLLFR